MEIQDIRRARLAQLIRDNYNSQADFVAKTGINQGEVSALLKDKSFGEKKARKIEEDSGMPTGWLDQADGPTPGRKKEAEPEVEVGQTPRRAQLQWVADDEARLLSDYRSMAPGEQELMLQTSNDMPKVRSPGLTLNKS